MNRFRRAWKAFTKQPKKRQQVAQVPARPTVEQEDRTGASRIRVVGATTAPFGFDPQSEALAERHDSNVATAVRIVGWALASLPLHVCEEIEIAGSTRWIPAEDHPAEALLKRPNPYHRISEIKMHFGQSLLLSGNGYTSIERVAGGSTPQLELWPLQPWKVQIEFTKQGIPNGYIYGKNIENISFGPTEMVHARLYNINNLFYGRSAIQPLQLPVLSTYYADGYNAAFFQNNASPGQMFVPTGPDGALTAQQGQQLETLFEERTKGWKKAHGTLISPVAGDLKQFSAPMKDLAFEQMLRLARERVYALFGIPPSVGGVYEFANYANARIQEASFWRNTMIPFLSFITDALNQSVLTPYFGEGYAFQFDLSGVEALAEDRQTKAQSYATLVNAGIFTPNEARDEGYELPPMEDGDALRSTPAPVVADPNATDPTATDPGKDEPPQGKKPPDKNAQQVAQAPRGLARSHASRESRLKRYEVRMAGTARKFWRGQKERILKRLDEQTANGALMSRLAVYDRDIMQIDDGDFDIIFRRAEEDAELRKLLEPFLDNSFEEVGEDEAGRLGPNLQFDVSNPRVQVKIKAAYNRSAKVNDASYEQLRRLFRMAYRDGWTIQDLRRSINDKFKTWSVTRAQLWAQTEMNGVINAADQETWRQGGFKGKQWVATQDDRTRDAHADADGQIVGIDEPFNVGGEQMDAPGDFSASAENTANCRCGSAPVV